MSGRLRRAGPGSWYPVVLAAGLASVLAVGAWGFALTEPGTVWDDLYRSLQLFVLESGNGLVAPLPWQLEVARLAAPALTVASTVVAVAVLSRNRVDRLRARRRRGHVVVCGLDRQGAVALALHEAGLPVVAVAADPAGAGVAHCRRAGVPVVLGDPGDPLVLADAGVPAADHLVVTTSALELGGRVALAAVRLVEGRTGVPLSIHLEIEDAELAALLRALKLTEHRSASWRFEELDLAGVGARTMLDTMPPWSEDASTAHLLVVGDVPLAAALAREARRRWVRSGRPDASLCVSRASVPGGWRAVVRDRAVTATYVCDPDESVALATALAVIATAPGTPVLVRLEHATAFGELVRRDVPELRVVSLDRQLLTPGVLLDSTTERMARALHDSYRRTAPAGDPSSAPWEELPEQLRGSNRDQAGHIGRKLRAVHRVLVPDDGEPPDELTEEEVDLLGRLEHERWVRERRQAGWTPGPRDPDRRTTPYLVPWDDLGEDVREIDRRFVRELTQILADAGLVVRRTGRLSRVVEGRDLP